MSSHAPVNRSMPPETFIPVVGSADPIAAEGAGGDRVMVRVEDVDRHHQRALEAGAQIVEPPRDYPHGEPLYSVLDPGGNSWTFSQSSADVDPASWGGVLQ